jgi:tRNA 2-selenouridine synthase
MQTIPPWQTNYSEIIDVRSPAEYREDRIPKAINLPVLDDEERAKVGTIYKQVSTFEARKLGAALVSSNIARHLTDYFADKPPEYRPLIYCWRGGQRSHSLALVLNQIGWRAQVLEGGYKTYRTHAIDRLQKLPREFQYKTIGGLTGTGKTAILQQLKLRGEQVLDLEAIARHRGSLLGEEWQGESIPQPSQKYFESQLLEQLQNFQVNRIVWLESESCKIGRLHLPHTLWSMMQQADCVRIIAPLKVRVAGLLQDYAHLIDRPDLLKDKLTYLKFRYGRQKIETWHELIDNNQWEKLVTSLLLEHYDPTYHRSLDRLYSNTYQDIYLECLSDAKIAETVKNLIETNDR